MVVGAVVECEAVVAGLEGAVHGRRCPPVLRR